jgi:predicted Zn-dependent peptidase
MEKINKVSTADIKRLAAELFKKERLSLAAIGPFTVDDFAFLDFKEQVQV